MKKDKKGFALLMQWAGKDSYYIYSAVILAFFASLCSIVPYYVFYRATEAVVEGFITFDLAIELAITLVIGMGVKALTTYFSIVLSYCNNALCHNRQDIVMIFVSEFQKTHRGLLSLLQLQSHLQDKDCFLQNAHRHYRPHYSTSK